MSEPLKMWAIKYPIGRGGYALLGHTISRRRDQAIARLMYDCQSYTWQYFYRVGYRAVRVEVREFEQ